MNINDFRFIRKCEWVLYYILRPIILLEYWIYFYIKNLKRTKKINRVFSTTGNISLVNVLSIINEIGDFDKYNDILFVDTGKGRDNFVKIQKQIAGLHNFKKIFIGYQIPSGIIAIFHNVFKVDEIYLLNHPAHINTITPLYPNAKLIFVDEGPSSLINYNIDKLKNSKSFKTHQYMGKLDFLGLENINKFNFEPFLIDEFRKIASILSKRYPIDIAEKNLEKAILYCGVYWEVSGLDKETFIREQNLLLNNLLNAGYTILYKAHPRDNDFYGLENNPNVYFINSKLPIELYNLDIIAVVTMSSTCALSIPHYWNIPCFSNVLEQTLKKNQSIAKLNIVRYMVKEYSPNYRELLNINLENFSGEELKQTIKKIYKNFISTKPLLSQNKKLMAYMSKMGGKTNE